MTSEEPDGARGAAAARRPLRSDAGANRARVLESAAEVFDVLGLNAGLDEVARRAGVGVGTLYRRFPTRAALLDALLTDLLEAFVLEAERALSLAHGAGLARFVRDAGELQATPRGCALPLLSAAAGHARWARVCAHMSQLLDDAKAHGTCRPDVTTGDLVGILVSLRAIREARASRVPLDWRRHLDLCLLALVPREVDSLRWARQEAHRS